MRPLLVHVGFRDNKPVLDVARDGAIVEHAIVPGALTLDFDTSQRYCTGWHDLETGVSSPCPNTTTIDPKFTQCPACQRRTGFNPAFYNSSNVSAQQDKRNHEPHFLYLAYFAPNVIKVGISYSGRGDARLLEQGSRASYVLDTLPTALIARQYEAKISSLDNMLEHLTSRRKRELWSNAYDSEVAKQQLDTAIKQIEDETSLKFSNPKFVDLNQYYFFETGTSLDEVVELSTGNFVSGDIIGCIGTDIVARNNTRLISLHLKNFLGYPVKIDQSIRPIELPPVQVSLF